jgi:hypothetical protein
MEDDLWLHANISEPDLAEMSDQEIAQLHKRLQYALQVQAGARFAALHPKAKD